MALLVKIERLKHATTVLMVFLAYLALNTPKTRSRSLRSHKKCKKVGFKHFDKTEKYFLSKVVERRAYAENKLQISVHVAF